MGQTLTQTEPRHSITIWGSGLHVGYLTFHGRKKGADKHLILLYIYIDYIELKL